MLSANAGHLFHPAYPIIYCKPTIVKIYTVCLHTDIWPPFCFSIKVSLVGTDLSPFRQLVICNDHHDQTLQLCCSRNTYPITFILPFLPLTCSGTCIPANSGPSRTTETCCTPYARRFIDSDVPCTHLLLLLSFSTLLQPAAKQTLPIPSIPAGGWKSSLPEIAQIIALQWYFFLLFRRLCFSTPSSISLSKLFCTLLFPENSSELFYGKKRENSQLIFFSSSSEGQESQQQLWFVLDFQKCESDPQT